VLWGIVLALKKETSMPYILDLWSSCWSPNSAAIMVIGFILFLPGVFLAIGASAMGLGVRHSPLSEAERAELASTFRGPAKRLLPIMLVGSFLMLTPAPLYLWSSNQGISDVCFRPSTLSFEIEYYPWRR
jgi:hypothetical protein